MVLEKTYQGQIPNDKTENGVIAGLTFRTTRLHQK